MWERKREPKKDSLFVYFGRARLNLTFLIQKDKVGGLVCFRILEIQTFAV